MGRMDGKVALITGAARGQGRSHAVRLAQEGAEIIALDLCEQVGSVPYPLAAPADLEETVRLVEELDHRCVAIQADVRQSAQMEAVVERGVSEFGHIDIVCANAGIASFGPAWELSDRMWEDVIDTNLTGVWRTLKAVIPTMIRQGTGGSLIITSSAAGLEGFANLAHYVSAKHGVIGLMRTLVNELSAHRIRVNCVNPTTVDTDMVQNEAGYAVFGATDREGAAQVLLMLNALPVPWVEAIDVSNAVLFLASDESRYVTGLSLTVDAGLVTRLG
ncbi:MAG: NAD(P)-dependent oxidoreductase [Chloroflexi bacterium]|nr:MAG: NAD(P)-dependent oxidoreductase [Chloroflexota bacterium]